MIAADAIRISPEVLQLTASINAFKGAWRALGTLAPDRLSALRRVAAVESIGSSTRIEGSKLSDREVERLLSKLRTKSFPTHDEQEVAGYAALTWLNEERDAGRSHPLLLIGSWVVVFLEIHPFQDGNGRLSRVLTTLLLLDGKRNTLKQHFRVLVERGHLAQHGAGRGVCGTSSRRHPMCHAAAAKKNKGALQVPMLRECAWYAKRIYLKKPLPFIIENGSSNIFNNSS
ncbi:Fic family protein [Verminephrobacter aporrectodeae]|uniref:Fic family protein n=1 Tax=Verminephrobacter aporrectodeae TaxID=1110389 RepID=UPI002238430F|nr:Fic family protein [Verminephrobacter aporrectodeae]